MNKKLLVGVFSAFMAVTPWLGNAATQVTDAPHANLTDGCENCHFAGLEPGNCTTRCHKSDVSPYADTVSPIAVTHKGLKCQACHNPHVSLQDQNLSAVVTGTFAGATYNAATGKTTLTGVTPKPEKRWAMKYGVIAADGTGVGKDRGMILWVANGADANGVAQRASFEIKDVDVSVATNYKVVVQGDASAIPPGGFSLQWGQYIAKKVTKDLTKGYIDGDRPVSFPPVGSSSRYVDSNATPGTTPQGICQVCHVGTKSNGKAFTHWNGNGDNDGHNVGRDCEECHPHSSGFVVTGCRSCHSGIGTSGAPTQLSELASPPTGSKVSGVHELHTGGRGGAATVFPCEYCHVGSGMSLSTPSSIGYGDGIQIGFNVPGSTMGYRTQYKGQAGVTYQGTNHTKVTNDGTAGNYTCSNVYCHSDGKATRLGCKTATPSTSPSWDTPMVLQADGSYKTAPDADGTKCNNCHGFSKAFANPISSNGHYNHNVLKNGIECSFCHGATVGAGVSPGLLAGTTKHVNGAIDVVGDGVNYTVTYNPVTKTCTTNCHEASSWIGPQSGYRGTQYSQYVDTATTCPDACKELDGSVGDAMMNIDPIIAAEVKTLDPNTLSIADMSLDPDRIDPVKKQCQGGIGFDGTPGYVKYQVLDVGALGVMGNYDVVANLDGNKVPALSAVVRTYRNIPGSTNGLDITTDPANPRVYYQYVAVDNMKDSLANAAKADTVGNGDTVSGWKTHIMTAVDLAHTNTHPIMDYVTPVTIQKLTSTSFKITITDKTVDPDNTDAAKQAYFGAGHNGGPGYARITFINPPMGAWTAIPLTGTPTPVTATFTGTSGTTLWYQYSVEDNHRITNADKTQSYIISSGWRKVTLP